MNPRSLLIITCIFGATAVGLGAFGAHALEETLTPERLETWNTAVTYQMWHTLGILVLLLIANYYKINLKLALNLMVAGVFIFSGSLYVLCLTGISWLGAITPIGGVLFILSWLLVGWGIYQVKDLS